MCVDVLRTALPVWRHIHGQLFSSRTTHVRPHVSHLLGHTQTRKHAQVSRVDTSRAESKPCYTQTDRPTHLSTHSQKGFVESPIGEGFDSNLGADGVDQAVTLGLQATAVLGLLFLGFMKSNGLI